MSDSPMLEALGDVEVAVSARVGNAQLPLASIVSFAVGTIVPLDCAPDSPASLLVNGVAIATGDLVTTDEGQLAIEISAVAP